MMATGHVRHMTVQPGWHRAMKASGSTKDTGADKEAIANTIIDGTAIAVSGTIADVTATVTATIAAEPKNRPRSRSYFLN
jgi:hypothetical protein